MKRWRVLLLALLTVASSVSVIHLQRDVAAGGPTYIQGPISWNASWTKNESPYVVTDNVTVTDGYELTIESGVVVKFNIFTRLVVQGTLIAVGEEGNPVTFTSNQSIMNPGDWSSIKLQDAGSSDSMIVHSLIEYPVYGIWCQRSSPRIENNTIAFAKSKGIYLEESSSHVTSNTIRNVGGRAIDLHESSSVITNNTIVDSLYYGIRSFRSDLRISGLDVVSVSEAIYLAETSADINSVKISSANYGIDAVDSSNITIVATNISDSDYGIYAVNTTTLSIHGTTISDCKNGVFAMDSILHISNSTMSGITLASFFLPINSTVDSLNTAFDAISADIGSNSTLVVRNLLEVLVVNKTNDAVEGALVKISDNELLLGEFSTDIDGRTRWLILTDGTYLEGNEFLDNVTVVEIVFSSLVFLDNPRIVDMDSSHVEVFTVMNKPPEADILDPLEGQIVGGPLDISGSCSDEDGEVVLVEVRVDTFVWSIASLSLDGSTWNATIDTAEYPNGDHTVEVRALDNDDSYSDSDTVNLSFQNPNEPPQILITFPEDGQVVSGWVNVKGSASDIDGTILAIQVRIDDGVWRYATSTDGNWSTWEFGFNSSLYSGTEHSVTARALDEDGGVSHDEVAMRFAADTDEDWNLLVRNAGVLVVLVFAFLATFWFVFSIMKRRATQATELEKGSVEEEGPTDIQRIDRLHEAYEAGTIPKAVYLRNLELLGGEPKQAAVKEEAVMAYECPECGNRVTADAKECDGCGAEFLE